ncbi:hypothetical protein LHYA1_G005427 [Lachnellula hyalina]|uniref:R3H-associated N-terminal domain-containing protein n=1 Tax=Lachnellula hyalina TaxID=1316788 RepID=A0A8H8QZ00_9HELO|nr:uncharacterized protein LHYA1_G005427 [Lachnellula hyalina]TVY25313.1 hypothetical protein LHYA1_G005427 [Lachnellula hyalina]
MAIYSAVPPLEQQGQAPPVAQSTSPSVGKTVTLTIPLDKHDEVKEARPRKEPLRRDSLKGREALLRGKEGSRRRQRWENDRLLHVPNAQPPLPSDWEVRPTWTVHHVPYYLAPLWDLRAEERSRSAKNSSPTSSTPSEFGRVPQELKAKLKKSKGARTLLQELELEVRKFVREYECGMKGERWEEQTGDTETETETEGDSEDEEIVFVGRNGRMSDEARARVERVLEREKKVWEGDVNDRGAGFGRWLVHSIAEYYGLSSRSITVGNPARREAYVAIKQIGIKSGHCRSREPAMAYNHDLPRPLYGLV